MSVELYPHNQKHYGMMMEDLRDSANANGYKGTASIVQPTGTGKSFLYLKYIEEHPDQKIVLCSSSVEIYRQLQRFAKESNVSMDNVSFLSFQSISRASESDMLQYKKELNPDCLILDEFQGGGAPKRSNKFRLLADENVYMFGATATPIRYLDSKRDMSKELFGKPAATEMTLGEAIAKELLPTPKYYGGWYDQDGSVAAKLSQLENEHSEEADHLRHKLDKLRHHLENGYGAEKILQENINPNGKYLVFCKTKDHAHKMMQEMQEWLPDTNTHKYLSISGRSDTSEQLQRFQADESDNLRLLFCINRLNEGIRFPGLDGAIFLRSTESPNLFLQQMGRTLSANGKVPQIFDLVNNYSHLKSQDKARLTLQSFEQDIADNISKEEDIQRFTIFKEDVDYNRVLNEIERICSDATTHDKNWFRGFSAYKTFKKTYNRDPMQDETILGYNVGKWFHNQKQLYRAGQLTKEREELLTGAGVDFLLSKYKENFIRKINLYKEYRKKYQKEPARDVIYQGTHLGAWLYTQKRKQWGPEDADKVWLLQDAGIILGTKQKPGEFESTAHLVSDFIRINKRIPKDGEIADGLNIGHWYKTHKELYQERLLPENDQELLKPIFKDVKQIPFADCVAAYKKFKDEHHREPAYDEATKLKDGSCFQLGRWCRLKRLQFLEGTLDDKATQLLAKASFPKQKVKFSFDECLELFKQYKEMYQKTPTTTTVFHGLPLGRFINKQRMLIRQNRISQAGQEKLIAVGFPY